MSIPNDIKIGILGAGGKMGMRLSANLKKLPNEVFYIENAEAGIKRLIENGLKVSAAAEVMDRINVLILAVPDILINKITTAVVPDLKPDSTVILLDPAAAYMNQVYLRESLHYTVIHPCHPALFKEQPTLEGYADHFGGLFGLQDIVSTHWKGSRDKYELACDIVRAMFAPVDNVFEITLEQMAFLLGHIKVCLAILLLGSNPASDAAMIAMDYGRNKLIKEDWKQVLTDEALHEVLTKMLKLDN
jgi:hypothetical protein